MFEMSNDVVNLTLREPAVVELLQSKETFDLLFLEIFLDDALLGLAHHYKCPVVAMSTMGATKWVNELTGSPNPLSYVPHIFLDMSDRMTFWQRLGNMVFTVFEEFLMKLFFYGEQVEKRTCIFRKRFNYCFFRSKSTTNILLIQNQL
jgi:glucuronosyltransferase